MELLAILAVLILGAVAMIGARRYYDSQDAAYVDPGAGISLGEGSRASSQAPFHRFPELSAGTAVDIVRLEDEGFMVTHFVLPTGYNTRVDQPATLVELPVDPPHFTLREGGAVPDGVGPAAAQELRYLSGVRVATAPHALLVVSIGAQARTVQSTAMRLAKALVADATPASSGSTTP